MRAAQEGMSKQDKLEKRNEYLAMGCSPDTANKFSPDLPSLQ